MTSLLRFNSKLVTHFYELSAWSQPPYRVRIVASIAIPFRTHFEAYLTAPIILRLVLFRATVALYIILLPVTLLNNRRCMFRVRLFKHNFGMARFGLNCKTPNVERMGFTLRGLFLLANPMLSRSTQNHRIVCRCK